MSDTTSPLAAWTGAPQDGTPAWAETPIPPQPVAAIGEVKQVVHDAVNHPRHYTQHPSGVECIEVVEHFGFNVGNAVKYLWRAGLKEGADPLEDLRKAAWYVQREIDRVTATT